MDLGNDLDWAIRGNCRTYPNLEWVPEREDTPVTDQQERICGMCPVKGRCLEFATENDVEGVWAGTNSYQRRVMQVPRNRAKCPGCGSRDVMDLGNQQVCTSCAISWARMAEL